ncbi:hypothetical protein [Bradyrhizobium sp. sGM-13]|uniref:hypothetical protein n=1 Tax=Bradyrhizobium sp. sGM-13 TaxID=2831781 RepID=UPI001BD1985D|nr:hypothetical protein [Bradyrhizobium sp. sGM-13]
MFEVMILAEDAGPAVGTVLADPEGDAQAIGLTHVVLLCLDGGTFLADDRERLDRRPSCLSILEFDVD